MPIDSVDEPISTGQAHETILQQLNRDIGDDFFPVESFENTNDWDPVPMIFAQEHPSLDAYDKDSVAELARISAATGRRAEVVGTPANTRIEMKGRPRLMSDLNWNADPEIQKLFDDGKLGISTAFWANTKDGSLNGLVKPHHVLLFEEDRTNQPRDKGAVVLNKETQMKAFTSAGKVMSGANQSKFQSLIESLKSLFDDMTGGGTTEDTPSPEEKKTPVANMETVEVDMTDEIIASKDAEILELKNKLGEIEQASKDAAWVALKNKLPPGFVHTPEDEAATRELFEKDPFAFTNKILDLKKESKPEAGQEFVNKDAPPVDILSMRVNVPGLNH